MLAWAVLYLEDRPYYPAVRVAAPGEVTYTALLEAQPDDAGCQAAVRRFLAPIAKGCAQCRVIFTRCARSAVALPSDEAPRYWVEAKGLRIGIAGTEVNAKASCELVARDLPESACLKAGNPGGR